METELDIDALWRQDDPIMQELYRDGADALFTHTPNIEASFKITSEDHSICCIDEGIEHGIHLAGSGCGIDEEALITKCKEAGITAFTTHDGCGKWKLENPEDINSKGETVEAWGERIAEKIGVPHQHITAQQMDRPATLHTARAIYLDGTGLFNRHAVSALPKGFTISPRIFEAESFKDLDLAIQIAFGGHGFGDRFTAEHKLAVIVIADPTNEKYSADTILKEIKNVLEKYPNRLMVSVIPNGIKFQRHIEIVAA